MSIKHDELMERVLERVEEKGPEKKRAECHHYPRTLEPLQGSSPLKLKCKDCGAVLPATIL